jgi:hypothetical protein
MSKLKAQIKPKAQITGFIKEENVLALSYFGIHLPFGF